jgi:hypothetical protein
MRHAVLLVLFGLAACARQDPFDRPGTWSLPANASNANDANLRTMVVDPRDLTAGTGEENSTSPEAAAPVKRLLTGKRAALPDSTISSVRVGGSAQQGQSSGAGLTAQPAE